MKDTLTIDCLIQAIFEAGDARAELTRARYAYTGYSFDYFYHSEIKRADDLAARAGELLNNYIDLRIEQKTGAS